jgi:hypothetical protein
MPTYNPLIPTGSVPLNLDYQNIQSNFSQLDIIYGTDHMPLTDATTSQGYHINIHSVPFSTTTTNAPNNQPVVSPTTVSNVGQIFTAEINDGFTTDEALYYKSGDGRVMQLTRNVTPSGSTNGYSFIAGGILIQWGTKLTTASSGTVTFASSNKAFPNNCWNVTAQLIFDSSVSTPSGRNTLAIDTDGFSKTKFDWISLGASSSYTGFFWVAIGN